LVANNQEEQLVRNAYLEMYPDKFEAIARFSMLLSESFRSNESLLALAEKRCQRSGAEFSRKGDDDEYPQIA
jgi:hypothetical protein